MNFNTTRFGSMSKWKKRSKEIEENLIRLKNKYPEALKDIEIRYEIHADGVKEVREECPFCKPDHCDEPHCPYTEEE